jgi:hypothetical protein
VSLRGVAAEVAPAWADPGPAGPGDGRRGEVQGRRGRAGEGEWSTSATPPSAPTMLGPVAGRARPGFRPCSRQWNGAGGAEGQSGSAGAGGGGFKLYSTVTVLPGYGLSVTSLPVSHAVTVSGHRHRDYAVAPPWPQRRRRDRPGRPGRRGEPESGSSGRPRTATCMNLISIAVCQCHSDLRQRCVTVHS